MAHAMLLPHASLQGCNLYATSHSASASRARLRERGSADSRATGAVATLSLRAGDMHRALFATRHLRRARALSTRVAQHPSARRAAAAAAAAAGLCAVAAGGAPARSDVRSKTLFDAAKFGSPRYDGDVCIVTGGSAGIGAACCSTLAAAGAVVYSVDVAAPPAAAPGVTHLACDVSDVRALRKAIGAVAKAHGRVDVLVSNAGVWHGAGKGRDIPNFKGSSLGRFPLVSADFWTSDHLSERSRRVDAFSRTRTHVEATLNHPFPAQVWHGGDFEAVDERAFDRVVGVNLKGTFFAIQAAVPHMRDRGGAVVIIGSDQSLVGKPEQHLYGCTKGAIAQLSKSLAAHYAPAGIRVNCVCPGTIDTPLMHGAVADFVEKKGAKAEELYAWLETAQPLPRLGTPAEVAALVACVAKIPFCVGSVISVDGGYTAQ